jgi:pimeloyl-ACP methyl ester carboxylesterase
MILALVPVCSSAAQAQAPAPSRAHMQLGLPASARIVQLPSSPSPGTAPVSEAAAMRVAIAGEGDAVVLLPGLFGSTFGYRKLIPKLAEAGYRAIALEPLGVGGSARPDKADYSLTAQADRIAAALPALGVERAVIVAHSAAASIAFRMAYRHPERVVAVVSLEGGAPEQAATPGFRRALTFAPLIRLFGGKRLIRRQVRSTLLGGAADKTWVTDEVVDGYMSAAGAELGTVLRTYRRMANAREPEPLAPRLAQVRCPVRLLLGAVPHQGGPNAAEVAQMQQVIPTLTVERVPGVGHYVYEEAPREVVRAIGSVLARGTGAAARADLSVPGRIDARGNRHGRGYEVRYSRSAARMAR